MSFTYIFCSLFLYAIFICFAPICYALHNSFSLQQFSCYQFLLIDPCSSEYSSLFHGFLCLCQVIYFKHTSVNISVIPQAINTGHALCTICSMVF